MPQTGVIVNKGLQLVFSREEAVNLAQTGSATVLVVDARKAPFGEATVTITALVQAAILEHMDLPIPTQIREQAIVERTRISGRVA